MTLAQVTLVALAPALSFALGLAVGVGASDLANRASAEPSTMLEAVQMGWDEATLRMIEEGQDPGTPMVAEDRVRHWKPGEIASPLLLAIAAGEPNRVAFMLANTALLQAPPNDQALCVVARYGHSNVAELLFRANAAPAPVGGCSGGQTPSELARDSGHGSLSQALERYPFERQRFRAVSATARE